MSSDANYISATKRANGALKSIKTKPGDNKQQTTKPANIMVAITKQQSTNPPTPNITDDALKLLESSN